MVFYLAEIRRVDPSSRLLKNAGICLKDARACLRMLVKRNPIEQRSCPPSFTHLSWCGPHHHQSVQADPHCRDTHHCCRIWLQSQIWEVSTNLEICDHIAVDLVTVSPHLSDKWACALRCSVCSPAVKNEDNSTGCQRFLAMGHGFSACVNQSSTTHVKQLPGDSWSGCVGLLSVLYAFTDIHCCISLDP